MDMWDDDSSPVAVASASGYENNSNSGFYVGRGRGFGNMSQMNNSLPKVGSEPSGDVWDDSSSAADSGWQDGSSDTTGGWKPSRGDSSYSSNRNDSNRGSNKCFKCQEEGHMSRDCPNSGSGGGGGRGCFKCGQEGHMSRECPNSDRSGGGGGGRNCHKCGETGHMARDCTSSSSGGGGGRACFKCGQEGHMSRDCPNSDQSGGGGGDRSCHKCGETGHMARDCTSDSGEGGGRGKGCFNCSEEGHMSKDCPNERKERRGGGGSNECFRCKQEGHMAKDCPNEVLGEDGKPRPPPYIPPEPSEDADDLFVGISTGINFAKYDEIHVDVSGANPPVPIESFESSGLCKHLLENIERSKYSKPTPVQKYSIPIIMKKRDLMACAQTGSGKTAAFLLPMLNEMIPNPDLPNNANNECQEPWAVIVAPTRELAIQIGSEARKFAYDSVVKADVVYGGTSVGYQSNRIKRGCHILVATPGRLLDFLNKGKVSFSSLRYLVLDEADRMLDMGFAPAIQEMVSHHSMPPKGTRQTLMFSATFPDAIQEMAKDFLNNYLFLTVGVVGAANSDVEQTFFNLGQYEKKEKLLEILKSSAENDRTLVFVEQKRTADFIASLCSQNKLPTTSIHGDRLQREREEALRDFRSGRMPVLVATAVAARGLDIKGVRHVINFDLPKSIDEYVHRIGRTGRVGNLGKATSFYDSAADRDLAMALKKILIDAQQEVPDWLSQEADQGSGGFVPYGGRGNFASRDVRNQNQGRTGNSSDNAYDNNFNKTSFQEPVAEDEDWG